MQLAAISRRDSDS
jgi:hypothetical protein